jgi:cell division protein ZapA (FtsZ GTPase activity inhibitor)
MKILAVNVLGSEYKIQTSEAGEALLGVVQEIVDTKLRDLRKRFPHQPVAQTAVLASLDLVGEFLEEEQKNEDRLKGRLRSLIDKLNNI